MARKGRHGKGGRTTPKGTRPQGYSARRPDDGIVSGTPPRKSDPMGDVRRALAGDHPMEMLALVSTLLTVVDPRGVNPFTHTPGERSKPSRDELLQTFTAVDRPETTALLAVVAAFGADEVERRRLERIVAGRAHDLPSWLSALGRTRAYRAVETTHLLGDGDTVVVGVRLPTGEELTAAVYIDHNMGTLVKDAFVVPGPIDDLLRLMRSKLDDTDTTFADIPMADAKARVVDAIEIAAITFPPFETGTWPVCRPLVEWIVGLLPDGGRGYERPDWSDADRNELTERFFASGAGEPLDDADHRGLLDSILWFGCDYGPGDPLRWSPTAVEILLVSWIPRKIVADVAYLSKAPEVLRAFITFCHAERGIPAHLTGQTLHAVDRWAPEYQATIRSPRPQGPAALLAAMGVLDGEDEDEPWDREPTALGFLERAVGGPDALEVLDDDALPDEPFDWTDIADDVRDRVGDVLSLIDRCCDELLDVEYRTACRRVLARVAVTGPRVFRRRGRSETTAAAICWAVCRVNDTFDQRRGGFTQKRLLAHFGQQGGSVSQRAATLLDAGGFPRHSYDWVLGSPYYLVSARRRTILDRRARFRSHGY